MSDTRGLSNATSSGKPDALHRVIAQTLRGEIASGAAPVGSMLPGEHELCARFHASRHTVRDSLRLLAEEGLVVRRQGAGTRVVSAAPRDHYVQSMQSLDDLRQYAADTVLRIRAIKEVKLPVTIAAAIRAGAGTQWLRITGVRFAGAEPICATEVFVHQRFAPMLADLEPGMALNTTIYTLIATASGEPIAQAEQEITGQPMPRGAASRLGQPIGAPALLFTRRYLDGAGGVMVCSFNWHLADRFVYRMRLQRE